MDKIYTGKSSLSGQIYNIKRTYIFQKLASLNKKFTLKSI